MAWPIYIFLLLEVEMKKKKKNTLAFFSDCKLYFCLFTCLLYHTAYFLRMCMRFMRLNKKKRTRQRVRAWEVSSPVEKEINAILNKHDVLDCCRGVRVRQFSYSRWYDWRWGAARRVYIWSLIFTDMVFSWIN